MASTYAVILSKEYADQLSLASNEKQIDQLPIGTGPYKYQEYKTGSLIRYYKHPDYWQETNDAQQVVFDITPNNSGRLAKLLAGECDLVAYPIAHQPIINNPNLTLESVTSLNVAYLGFNTAKPPFNNKMVRRAVAHAINKKAIIDAVYFGRAEAATSVLPQSSWAYDNSLTHHMYDPELAKQLLTQAGYPDGLTIDVWAMPVRRAYNPDALTMAKLIQSDLQQIGISVNIISYEWVTFLRRLSKGEHQSVLLGWSADHPANCIIYQQAEQACAFEDKRLPTEAEWSKAARGEKSLIFPWGNAPEPSCDLAVINQKNGSKIAPGCGAGTTQPVGSKPKGASPYGLMDMAGNLFQWTSDWYSESYFSTSPVKNPKGPTSGASKVLRGSAWTAKYRDGVALTVRTPYAPQGQGYVVGARCAK